jgi:transcriptional regulator with XRE-family HTH domain
MAKASYTTQELKRLKAFGDAVRKLRLQRGWSQEAFAELTGLHRTYIGSLERGERNVSLLNISKLATTLGTSPSLLLALAE